MKIVDLNTWEIERRRRRGDSDDELMIERAARSVSEGHYKKRPKDGEPKLGVVHFLDGAL